MFTGLVEGVGEIVERKATSGGCRLRIGTALAPELKPGDSLAVNGVCLTVILAEGREVHADVGPETIRVTTLGTLEPAGAFGSHHTRNDAARDRMPRLRERNARYDGSQGGEQNGATGHRLLPFVR